MTIVAMCPYCRVGGVRAPEQSIGASATCPNCGSNFTVMPDSGLPGWSRKPSASPPPDSVTETRPHAASADVTEPSPVLAPDARPVVRPVGPPPAPPGPSPELTLPLAAVVLFGPAVLATQLPAGRWVALAVSLVGGLLGFLSLGAEGRARLIGAAAVLLHGVVFAVVILAPEFLGLDPWRKSIAGAATSAPQSQGHRTGLTAPADWVDASTASWRAGDVRVTVRSATVGPVELVGPNGAKRTPKDSVLQIVVRVVNEGPEHRIELADWAVGAGGGALADGTGKAYKPKRFEAGWEIPGRGKGPSVVYPSKWVETTLVFDPPEGRTNGLKLELAGAGVGVPHPVRFTIPDSFLSVRRPQNRP